MIKFKFFGTYRSIKMITLTTLIMSSSGMAENVTVEKKSAAYLKLERVKSAYAKEYAFLLSERESLNLRLSNFQKDSDKVENELDDLIFKLEKQISALEKANAGLALKNKRLIGEKADIESGLDNIKSIPQVAADGILKHHSLEIKPQSLLKTKLKKIFEMAVKATQDNSEIQIQRGEFFDQSGQLVSGEIAKLGSYMAFAKTDSADPYLLIPTDDGKYKAVRKVENRDLHGSTSLAYLFENNKPVIEKKKKKFSDTLNAGGTIGYVILSLGLISGFLLLLRFRLLNSASKGNDGITLSAEKALLVGDVEGAKAIVAKNRGPLGKVLSTSLDFIDAEKDLLETTMSEVILEESSKLDRFSTMIVVTAAVAPLLGLLGTVTGMIATFDIITDVGTGDPKMLSGGISEALVTTMFGLIVAIPTLFFGQLTSKWAEKIKDVYTHGTLSVVAAYETFKTGKSFSQ